jgi:hypothetical protein
LTVSNGNDFFLSKIMIPLRCFPGFNTAMYTETAHEWT